MAKTPSKPSINIGISEKDRAAIAKGLSHLLTQRLTAYEQTAWMLRSLLED
jgi:starvation-inducible DNA-binding protein